MGPDETSHAHGDSLGHCFVEPVRVAGQRWTLRRVEQFGWGGGAPDQWKGTGTVIRLSDHLAIYKDRGGEVLRLLPVQDPRTETGVCD